MTVVNRSAGGGFQYHVYSFGHAPMGKRAMAGVQSLRSGAADYRDYQIADECENDRCPVGGL